ncbi:Ureidoglycolate hydrolase [Arcobacter nitrofigilis DSM 7299]|uniref:Ureidoglycolate hydrolase n=1 Tax=Arcobacter nitrofigilis (strain ATCC 33309 / DSM 7299 / CCUG 15893 / LMG 7604 / NCTC 12251 / CI) TaxID=572480 RepID=D5V3E9_ARCNC|nr:ureidoglycolate lyase [Arcobacter nitrofigilis]ADG92731.1 Ureidoglycolate hydrolase [Arcobacter nitrofigilis DSM 7299]
MKRVIKPELLTRKTFKKYGEVISTEDSDSKIINDGFAKKYYELCIMDANENNGKSTLHIYEAKKREFPLKISMLEKHPFFSQTFMPRSTKPFLVVVALGEDEPDLSTLKAFLTNGNQGVYYNRGIWHFPLISLEDNEQFIVIDRSDCAEEENKIIECIELELKGEIYLLNE